MANRKHDYASFVKQWSLSANLAEAATKTGMDPMVARALANRLRKQGVKLKFLKTPFVNKRENEVAALNKLIEETT